MTQDKKDLTRIEDLGEFLHELDETENYLDLPALPETVEEENLFEAPALPDLPAEDPEVPDDGPLVFEQESEPEPEPDVTATSDEPMFVDGFSADDDEALSTSVPQEETAPFTLSEPEEKDEPLFSMDDVDEDPIPQPAPEAAPEPFPESAPLAELHPEPDEVFAPKETFEDTRSFAEKAVLAEGPAECNPAYSVIARNIRFLEDSEEILSLLKEVGFPETMRTQFQRQLERGTLLIPRVSEFTAIFVCHRLRRFRLELQMGLSDLLHPPKNAQESDKGLVSRKSLGQNQQHQFLFKGDADGARNIILSTLPQLDGHAIERYLGVASEHAFLGAEVVENETAEAIHKSYDELAQKLKAHALEHKANAVVGINYQLTPMPHESALGNYRYKLTCTGNLVWVHRPTE
jgi:uncharacterized protein YbjQ (UPF0145 family)